MGRQRQNIEIYVFLDMLMDKALEEDKLRRVCIKAGMTDSGRKAVQNWWNGRSKDIEAWRRKLALKYRRQLGNYLIRRFINVTIPLDSLECCEQQQISDFVSAQFFEEFWSKPFPPYWTTDEEPERAYWEEP
jgi:hypothetical protein